MAIPAEGTFGTTRDGPALALEEPVGSPRSSDLPPCPACGSLDAWGGLIRWVSTGTVEAACDRCHTRFTFVLDEPTWRVRGVGSAASVPTRAPQRLLLIEDDRLLSDALRVGLAGAGYLVQTASHGYTGLRLAQSQRPDLVLLDLRLPELSGDGVLAELRRDPRTAEIPVVVVAGQPETLSDARQVAAVLHKPVSLAAVLATVWQSLNGADRHAERSGASAD